MEKSNELIRLLVDVRFLSYEVGPVVVVNEHKYVHEILVIVKLAAPNLALIEFYNLEEGRQRVQRRVKQTGMHDPLKCRQSEEIVEQGQHNVR